MPTTLSISGASAGTTYSLRSGASVRLLRASPGASLNISETSDRNGGTRLRVSVANVTDSVPMEVRVPMRSSIASPVVRFSTDTKPEMSYFVSAPATAASSNTTVPSPPTGIIALASATAPARVATLAAVNIGPKVVYEFEVMEAVRAASQVNECPNVYQWTERRAGSGAAPPTIVLIHGWQPFTYCNDPGELAPFVAGRMANYNAIGAWQPMEDRLAAEYPSARIVTVRYATEMDPITSAAWLVEQLQRDPRVTSQSRVVLVGHSMGGLVARAVAARWSEISTRPTLSGIVTLGTPHLGTPIANEGIGGVLNGRYSPLDDAGTRSLRVNAFEGRVPFTNAVPMHLISGVVGCSEAAERQRGVTFGLLLAQLCAAANRTYWRDDCSQIFCVRIYTTSFAGVSDAVVPTTSSSAAGRIVAGRETLPGAVAHEELQAAPAALEATTRAVFGAVAPVATLALSGLAATMRIGDLAQGTATLRASNGTVLTGRAVAWTSSNSAVVAVSATGQVRAASAGTATITARAEGQSASITITVAPDAINVDCSRAPFPPAQARVITPTGGAYSAGTGQYFLAWNLGIRAQNIVVTWDMQGVPDGLAVCFRGQRVFTTGGLVSGGGSFTLAYPGAAGVNPLDPSQSIFLYLSVDAPNGGTAWSARVNGTYVAPAYGVPGPFLLGPVLRESLVPVR